MEERQDAPDATLWLVSAALIVIPAALGCCAIALVLWMATR
jgi:NADH:ubiquinone oxidoreductase subunit B-like Fe-S oxidoreductase